MTAPVRQNRISMDPVADFTARAEGLAILWAEGEIDLHTAVNELWAAAESDGLVKQLGVDAVQRILAEAFSAHEDLLPAGLLDDLTPVDADPETDIAEPHDEDEYEGLTSSFAKACREADERARAQRKRQRDHPEKPHVAETTLAAAQHLVREGDAERLRAWLARHSPEERQAIHQHLRKAQQCRSRPKK
jgi:hypothetical protein